MSETHIIKTKGGDYTNMRLQTIRQTYNIFCDRVAETDVKPQIDMTLYLTDVQFLLHTVNGLLQYIKDKEKK